MQLIIIALALAAVQPPPQPMSVEVVRDPITDHVRAYATVREERQRLVVSCDSAEGRRPVVTVHSDRWMKRGSLFTGFRPITYRFDAQRPRRQMWHIEHRHATLTGRRRNASFLERLMAAEKLVVRTQDLEDNRLDLTFHLRGVTPAIEQVMSACTGRPWTAEELRA